MFNGTKLKRLKNCLLASPDIVWTVILEVFSFGERKEQAIWFILLLKYLIRKQFSCHHWTWRCQHFYRASLEPDMNGTQTNSFFAYNLLTLSLRAAVEWVIKVFGTAWRSKTKSLCGFFESKIIENGLRMQFLLFFALFYGCPLTDTVFKKWLETFLWHCKGYWNLAWSPFVFDLPRFYQSFTSFDFHINDTF